MKSINDIITEKFKIDKEVKAHNVKLSENCKKELDDLVEKFDNTFNTYYDELDIGDDDWDADDFYIQVLEDFLDKLTNKDDFYINSALSYIFKNYKIKN